MIDRLSAVLRAAGMTLSARELAEIVWLATKLPPPNEQLTRSSESTDHTAPAVRRRFPAYEDDDTEDNEYRGDLNSVASSGVTAASPGEKTHRDKRRDSNPLMPVVPSPQPKLSSADRERDYGQGGPRAVLFSPNSPSPLSARELARSFLPLRRRVSTRREKELDVLAMTNYFADTGLLMPIWQSSRGRWIDVALVVDIGRSMDVWLSFARDFHSLLCRVGVFRSVSLWGLDTSDSSRVFLYRSLDRRSVPRVPRELNGSGQHRALLFLSDCVSASWRAGTVVATLRAWAEAQSVAVLQVLPRALWARTTLGEFYRTRVFSHVPLAPNKRLESIDHLRKREFPVPLLSVTAPSLRGWSAIIACRGGVAVEALVLGGAPRPRPRSVRVGDTVPADDRVRQFVAVASQAVCRLASVCAAAPVISIPVLRRLQQTFVPEATVYHLAEIMISGLLEVVPDVVIDRLDPDQILYSMDNDIRGILLGRISALTALEVVHQVSRFVEEECGVLIEFASVVRGELGDVEVRSSSGRQFARVAPSVLHAIGISSFEHSNSISLGSSLAASDVEATPAIAETWKELVSMMEDRHVALLRSAVPLAVTSALVRIALDPQALATTDEFNTKQIHEAVAAAAKLRWGVPCLVELVSGALSGSPSGGDRIAKSPRNEEMLGAEKLLRYHPLVLLVCEVLGAEVEDVRLAEALDNYFD